MVLENPRKVPHKELYDREIKYRLEVYEGLRRILCETSVNKGMETLQFSRKKLYKQFQAAFYLAGLAHRGQTDKGGCAYICHPVTVAMHLQQKAAPSPKRDRAMIVALLHDTLEDTPVTVHTLKCMGFGSRIIHTVELLSREEGQAYPEYLERVMQSKLAMTVKIADLTDNQNLYRIENPSQRDINRSEHYRSCRGMLLERLREE